MADKMIVNKKSLSWMFGRKLSYIKSLNYIVLSIILISVSFTVNVSAAEVILSPEQCQTLAVEIKDAENRISNIKIESETWWEKGDTESGPWERTPLYWSSTSWFDGDWSTTHWTGSRFEILEHPEGKGRVDVHKRVIEWKEGAYPYAEHSCSFGFDGEHARYVRHTFGFNGKTNLVNKGRQTIEPGNKLKRGSYRAGTGIAFSLQFFDNEIYSFSKFAELAGDPNAKPSSRLKFSVDEFQGVECVKISSKFSNLIYWLDINHGFALRGEKRITQDKNGNETLISFMKVNKLKEVSDGIWWPMEVSDISRRYNESDEPYYERFIYKISAVTVNDPNFDESVFTVPFPEGYKIEDKVKGKTYTVGEK